MNIFKYLFKKNVTAEYKAFNKVFSKKLESINEGLLDIAINEMDGFEVARDKYKMDVLACYDDIKSFLVANGNGKVLIKEMNKLKSNFKKIETYARLLSLENGDRDFVDYFSEVLYGDRLRRIRKKMKEKA